MSLSVAGLWGMWNILVKGTLGVATTVIMAATTPVPDLLHGLEHLRLPKVFVGICAFMIRYTDVIASELHRMRVARVSRGRIRDGSGRPRPPRHRPARCSSARTSAASACTSRWRHGATRARCRWSRTTRRPRTSGSSRLALPAVGAVIAAVAWVLV